MRPYEYIKEKADALGIPFIEILSKYRF